jgi:hypothetical protein
MEVTGCEVKLFPKFVKMDEIDRTFKNGIHRNICGQPGELVSLFSVKMRIVYSTTHCILLCACHRGIVFTSYCSIYDISISFVS